MLGAPAFVWPRARGPFSQVPRGTFQGELQPVQARAFNWFNGGGDKHELARIPKQAET
jgi:hypothetical protein